MQTRTGLLAGVGLFATAAMSFSFTLGQILPFDSLALVSLLCFMVIGLLTAATVAYGLRAPEDGGDGRVAARVWTLVAYEGLFLMLQVLSMAASVYRSA